MRMCSGRSGSGANRIRYRGINVINTTTKIIKNSALLVLIHTMPLLTQAVTDDKAPRCASDSILGCDSTALGVLRHHFID
jgi:hypothetical protein